MKLTSDCVGTKILVVLARVFTRERLVLHCSRKLVKISLKAGGAQKHRSFSVSWQCAGIFAG